jgi:acetyl esterase/lipase
METQKPMRTPVPRPTLALRPGSKTIQKSSMNKILLFPAVTLASFLSLTCATAGPSGETNATTAGEPAWPEIHPSVTNLAYAEKSPLEKLDLYLPAAGNVPAPLVIWIHGGAFMVGDKHSMPRRNFGPPPKPTGRFGPFQVQVPNTAVLVSRGYAVVSLNYRLTASFLEGALPGVQDGKAAVRFLRANAGKYNLDPNRFAVWGNSAGGYMAAMIGATGDQPTIFDDPTLGDTNISSAVQACIVWYGAEDRLPPNMQISTYLPSAKVLPAYLIANGDADLIISVSQAQRLNDALKNAGAKSSLTILPGAGHEDPAYMTTQMAPCFAFLDGVFGMKTSMPQQ